MEFDDFTQTRTIQDLYESFDNRIELMLALGRKKGKNPSCKIGCSACCYDLAIVFDGETEELVRKIPAALLGAVRERAREWVEKAKPHGLVDVGIARLAMDKTIPRVFYEARLRCPLLGKTDKGDVCIVYEDRPFACRGHYSFSDPALCGGTWDEHFNVQTLNVQSIVAKTCLEFGGAPSFILQDRLAQLLLGGQHQDTDIDQE